MPRRKRNKQVTAAVPLASSRVTVQTAEPEDEGKSAEALEKAREKFRKQGYVSTHTLCSAVGYLIGVRRRNFRGDDDIIEMQQSVYDVLDCDKNCRSVRNLCQIRAAIMRNFDEARNDVQSAEYQKFLKKYVEQPGVLNKLHQDGCTLPTPGLDLNEYLLIINQRIGETFERLHDLPYFKGIEFSYLKKAMLYPGGIKKEQIGGIPYRRELNSYPFHCYLNLEMPGYNINILAGDDDFVELLYKQNGAAAPDIRTYRRSYGAPGLEKLANFMTTKGHYQYLLYIDGAGIHTRELRLLLPKIRSLNENQLGECILYCPHDKAELWSTCLDEERENITLSEPKEEYASQGWAARVAVDMGMRAIDAAGNAAYVIITPSDETIGLLKEKGTLDKRNFFVVLARQPSDFLLRQLNNREDFCVLEELIGELPEEEPEECTKKQIMARAALQHTFPLDLKYTLQELVEKQLAPMPDTYTSEERQEYELLLRSGLRLDIRKDGRLQLVLDADVWK